MEGEIKHKKNFKKIIAIALVLFMTVSNVPFTSYAMAEEIDTPVITDSTTQSATGNALSVVSGSSITVRSNTEDPVASTVSGR